MTFLEYKEKVAKLFDSSIAFAENTNYASVTESMMESKKRLEKNDLMIVVCGEVKRGKSSLLSALLEEEGLFPVDVNVATNTVTIVRYGAAEKIEVIFNDNTRKRICRNEIADYCTEQGNEKNRQDVNCLNIEINNSKLKDGLVYIDTPGVGSLNLAHSEVTYSFLPNADVLLFVSDALSPLTEPELKFLQRAHKYCKNIIFPLTKIDKSSSYPDIMKANAAKISEYLSIAESDITILPVSSIAKLTSLKEKNPMMLKRSNFNALEESIWKTVMEKRIQILMVPPLSELAKDLKTAKSNLAIKSASLSQNNESVKKMEGELKKASQDRQKLLEDGAEWRNEIRYSLDTVNSDIRSYIQTANPELENKINSLINQKNAAYVKKNLDEITADINNDLLNITYEVKSRISSETASIREEISDKLGLNINTGNEVAEKINVEVGAVPIEMLEKGKMDKAISVGRSMSIQGAGGGAAGGLLGALVGGVIGFFIGGPAGAIALGMQGAAYGGLGGAVLGGGKGLYEGMKVNKGEDIPTLNASFKKYAFRKLNELATLTTATVNELVHVITTDLNNKIKNQRALLEQNISDIQENITLSREEAAVEMKKVNSQLQELNALETNTTYLLEVALKSAPAKQGAQ